MPVTIDTMRKSGEVVAKMVAEGGDRAYIIIFLSWKTHVCKVDLTEYDVIVMGGGIAGSVAARYTAENGLRTLLLEREATPRNKPCSGVQLPYMEKLIGANIPRECLCANELKRVSLTTPTGQEIRGGLRMLNYWRSTFDAWLNRVAVEHGADFMDRANVTEFGQTEDGVEVKVNEESYFCRYLVGADGLSPSSMTRRQLKPMEFAPKVRGTAINYYFRGESEVEPETLHIFFKKEFSNLMFSWLYYKDDQLVVGTSSDTEPARYAERFYGHVEEKFRLRGEVFRREGYVTSYQGGICLGEENVLLVGDAAGFLDLYRGVGMDTAALSGRICAHAVKKAVVEGGAALKHYRLLAQSLVKLIEENDLKQKLRYESDDALERSLSRLNVFKGQMYMAYAGFVNRFLSPERIILLPP
jgi:flavin-dependent dehydrogenase